MKRCFIALGFDEELQTKLSQVQKNVQKAVETGIRWETPKNFHITLKFIGDTSTDLIAQISDSLESFASEKAFPLSFTGIGVFPKVEKARVFWLGVKEEEERVQSFQKEVEKSMIALSLSPEKGLNYTPHVTIGRANKREKLPESLAEILEEQGEFTLGPCLVNQLVLFESHFVEGKIHYAPLKTVFLS